MSHEMRWSPTESGTLGQSLRRRDDLPLVTGSGRYVADLETEEMLHAHFVRSPVAHGALTAVDTARAEAVEGVVAVLTASSLDLPMVDPPPTIPRHDLVRPPLAVDRVRYVGEPLAVVVAQNRATAADAADLVWPEIDELPIVMETDPEQAESTFPLFEGSNLLTRQTTDPRELAPQNLPIKATVTSQNQRVAAVALEGLAIVAEPLGDRLKVTCGHQAPHRFKQQLADMLATPAESIQVVVPDVGGAFGLKGAFFTEYVVVASLAQLLARPVMWLEDRREHLVAGMHGRGQTHTVTLEGEASGRIRRADISYVADLGAYPQGGAIIPLLTRFVASGLYDIDEVTVDMSMVVTNRAPTTSYRGAGRPEAAFAIERAVDEFAAVAGLDPAEVRRVNFIRSSQLPYETTTGARYDSGDYAKVLDDALSLADVDDLRREQRKRRETGGRPLGVGIGAFVERTGGATGTGEYSKVEIDSDGTVHVRTGSTDSGQGHSTVWSQIVAGIFDLNPAAVEVIAGDTDQVADGVGTYASRSAQIGGSAAYRMGLAVLNQVKHLAAEMLEASPADIAAVGGELSVAGVPDSAIPLAEIANYAEATDRRLSESEMFVPDGQAFPYGVHIAVVEVDPETGVVDLLRLVTIDDCGNVLNPMIVEGQIHGSLVQGLGQALYEGVTFTEDGTPLTSTLMDYLVPTASSIPEMVSGRNVTQAPNNPLGAKGTGEAGCIGAPPAIVNAVIDALRPYGVTNLDMPLSPARVWAAIRSADHS